MTTYTSLSSDVVSRMAVTPAGNYVNEPDSVPIYVYSIDGSDDVLVSWLDSTDLHHCRMSGWEFAAYAIESGFTLLYQMDKP